MEAWKSEIICFKSQTNNKAMNSTIVAFALSKVLPDGSAVKKPPAMNETQVQSLGQEDPWRWKWQPILVFLPGKSHGQRSLGDRGVHGVTKELDMT